ncbi:MAG: permease prefix domain 1-containing protein [Treponema sp.]|nr:permease prefix domain 1-containing protein [Treponema sp.]
MNTREYVQSLFSDYEESVNLNDFMEEIQSNLDARIASLVGKGSTAEEAFDKACAELGDISALAKELSLKKRREVFEEVYMDVRKYMSPCRITAYVIFGFVALFGVIISFISYFATRSLNLDESVFAPGWLFGTGMSDWPFQIATRFHIELGITVLLGTLLPFLVASVAGFTYLGLTQETKTHYPMGKKRAAWYTVAAALICFGLLVMFITYFTVRFGITTFSIMISIATLIPFVLPGGGILCYLLLSEKKRFKPWAASMQDETAKKEMEIWNDPATASRFGMFSGAIWIFAIALFLLLGFLVGFRFSWLVFVFAVAIQLLVQGLMMKK